MIGGLAAARPRIGKINLSLSRNFMTKLSYFF